MADVTGAPPSADAGAAQVAEAEQILADIRQMPPDDVRSLADEYEASFNRPPPAPLSIVTPRDAAMRIAELGADENFMGRLRSGDITAQQELDRLMELKANATVFDPVLDQFGDTAIAPALSRRNQISAAADLRAEGASDYEINHHILGDRPYPPEIVRDAYYWLPRMQANPNLQVPISVYNEVDRDRLMGFFKRAIAIGDGS
jgi:hypothetical protein